MSDTLPDDLSALAALACGGDAGATDRLSTTLYRQLHRLARREAGRLGPQAALGATTLPHEAWPDISKRDALAFPTEGHFMACAARAMRGLVIDRVRESQAQKRGGVNPVALLDGTPISGRQPGHFGPVAARLQAACWALHDDPRYPEAVR